MARKPAAPAPDIALAMPLDVRAMNLIAATVGVLFLAGLVLAGVQRLAGRPFFAIASVRIEGDLQRNNVSTVRANALPQLRGNFFTLDLGQARAAFEAVPWVRHAVVRRVWPNHLVVRLEEHRPVALWAGDEGSDRMVNLQGEVFEANLGDVEDDSLPEFSGPDGSSAQVLAMYQKLRPVFSQLDADITSLALSGRGSWRAELDSGAAIEIGRGNEAEVVERTQRFVHTLPQMLKRFHAPLETADLRHAEGYAVKLKGITVAAAPTGPGSNSNNPQAAAAAAH